MPSTNLNVRIDTEIKQAAEKVFADLGLNLSSAINIFLRQAIRVNGIPFDLHNGDQTEKVIIPAPKSAEPVIAAKPEVTGSVSEQVISDKSDMLSELFDFRTE